MYYYSPEAGCVFTGKVRKCHAHTRDIGRVNSFLNVLHMGFSIVIILQNATLIFSISFPFSFLLSSFFFLRFFLLRVLSMPEGVKL